MIEIFLIERQKIVREGIKVLLEEEVDFKVYTSENKDVKISLINRLKPDLIVVSLDKLDEADFSYLNIFLDLNKNREDLIYDRSCKIIVYAEKVNEFILNKVLNIGCQGYLLKESSIEELKQAIRSVYKGYKHIGNSVFSQVKQLSVASKGIALEQDIAVAIDSYQTGLRTTGSMGSDELDYADLQLDSLNSLYVSQEKLEKLDNRQDNFAPQTNSLENRLQLLGKPKKRWREVCWIMLSSALGCMAGIAGAWAYGAHRYRSLPTITKYGTINSNTIAIKTPLSGTIERVNYQVGDLVKANDVVAQIEPASIRRQQQDKNALAGKIEQTKQQLDSEKQLLEGELVQLQQKQQKLQELLINKIVKPDKSIDNLPPPLDSLNNKVAEAYKDYQNLQQLNDQNIVSQSELTRARQTWLNAKRELIQSNPRQSTNLSNTNLQVVRQLEVEQLREKIDNWQTKTGTRKKALEVLEQSLANLQNRWQKADSKLSDSSQTIELKAPFIGVVKQIAHPGNQVVAKDETVLDLVSCQNLWVEVTLNGESLRQIDFQQPVAFHLENYRHDLRGKISSIESLAKFNKTKLNLPYYKTSIAHSYLANDAVENEMMFKIIVNFPLLENYMQQQEFCGVGDAGLITFNN